MACEQKLLLFRFHNFLFEILPSSSHFFICLIFIHPGVHATTKNCIRISNFSRFSYSTGTSGLVWNDLHYALTTSITWVKSLKAIGTGRKIETDLKNTKKSKCSTLIWTKILCIFWSAMLKKVPPTQKFRGQRFESPFF